MQKMLQKLDFHDFEEAGEPNVDTKTENKSRYGPVFSSPLIEAEATGIAVIMRFCLKTMFWIVKDKPSSFIRR